MSTLKRKRPVFSNMHPLRRLRLSADVSLRELGEASGVDFRRLALIERGLSDEETQRVAKALTVLGGRKFSASDLAIGQ